MNQVSVTFLHLLSKKSFSKASSLLTAEIAFCDCLPPETDAQLGSVSLWFRSNKALIECLTGIWRKLKSKLAMEVLHVEVFGDSYCFLTLADSSEWSAVREPRSLFAVCERRWQHQCNLHSAGGAGGGRELHLVLSWSGKRNTENQKSSLVHPATCDYASVQLKTSDKKLNF